MDRKLAARIIFALLSLFLLYSLGLPPVYLAITGIMLLLLLFMRGAAYKKIDAFLARRFPIVARLPPWGRMLLVILIFILVYALLKQIVFELLKTAGIDMQQMMYESINESLNG